MSSYRDKSANLDQWMHKTTPLQSEAQWGRTVIMITNENLEKMASEEFIPNKIAKCIAEVRNNPDPSMSYFVDRAMGAGEYYRANNNGDYFPEEMLRRDHPTFEKHAKIYRNHMTFAPPVGDVMCADYNDKLHTVDLVMRAPLEKVAVESDKLNRGVSVKTSMGCSVPYDECSICGNRAKNKSEYCDHIRFHKHQIVNGRQAYMINRQGVFKDISIVVVPAAPESSILRKIASYNDGHHKASSMIKRLPSMVHQDSRELRGAVDPKVIKMLSHLKTADSISTLHTAVGVLRPDEFQALLHKDASLLVPECVPVLHALRCEEPFDFGMTHTKLAGLIRQVYENQEPDTVKYASWIDDQSVEAYMAYRQALPAPSRFQDRLLYLR